MQPIEESHRKAKACMLFEGVEESVVLELLRTYALPQRFCKGEVIYCPQHYKKSLGILVRGQAVVQKECGVLLNILGEGQCFGAAALFVPQDRYVTTVRAKTDCEILFLSMADMQNILLQNPVIAFNYIRFLSGRIQFLNRKIDSFTAPNAQQALLSFLRQQPDGKCSGISMVKLSEILNIGRTSLYRAAEQLEQCGKIKREGKTIQLMPEVPYSPKER